MKDRPDTVPTIVSVRAKTELPEPTAANSPDLLQDRMATLSTNSSHRVVPYTHVALVTEYNAAQASSRAICDVVHSVRFTIPLKKS